MWPKHTPYSMIYYSIQLVLCWIHCRQDRSPTESPAIAWDSADRPQCWHLGYWSDWWIDDVSASPFFSPGNKRKRKHSFNFLFRSRFDNCGIFTVSWFVLFDINITSDGNGDCDGEGCSLGLAGIDGDGLGVRKGPGGDNIPNKYENINNN